MALELGVKLSKTSPAFLHANSTSHTWCFSAIAEIIDNAYDPDVGATELRIDKSTIKGIDCLAFTDNGAGMTSDKLHHMLSFGYCEKVEVNGHKPVGQYGNGFKSGSMRLGMDAVVITKSQTTWSVGFLSQTFLAAVKSDTVLVPIITCNKITDNLHQQADMEASLKYILTYSVFSTFRSLVNEYRNLERNETGTRIIVYNLKRGADKVLELDFNSNPKDIINSEHHEFDQSVAVRVVKEYTPEYRRSLREYCSILFLKPRMKIILRGEKVKTKLISKSLQKTEVALYRPRFVPKPVKIILGFGFSNENCGMMLYHRNRLIKAYERVGCQKQQNGQGVGVVGVVEVDFLDPVHNKQDFNKTDRYNACMNILAQKLNDYWQEKTNSVDSRTALAVVDWTWAQCDNQECLKWRRMPAGIIADDLPEKWFCYMNLDPTHNRCDINEEPEDEDALIELGNTYEKRVRQQKSTEQTMRTNTIQQREQELKEREEHLSRVKKEIEKLRPLAQESSGGPTLADLERAQKQLEEAKRREDEKQQIIDMLQEEKERIAEQQRIMGNNVMANISSIAAINDIALNGTRVTDNPLPPFPSNVQRKRKSPDDVATQNSNNNKKRRPEETTAVAGNNLHNGNGVGDVSNDDESSRDEKPQIVVKLGKKGRSKESSVIIVIDSEDDDAGRSISPIDVKPDVDRLRRGSSETEDDGDGAAGKGSNGSGGRTAKNRTGRLQVGRRSSGTEKQRAGTNREAAPVGSKRRQSSAENGTSARNRSSDAEIYRAGTRKDSAVPSGSGSAVVAEESKEPSREASAAPVVPRRLRNVKTQTLIPDAALTSLRRNVAKLLRVILPDMTVFANIPLENVDSALVEVLRVNEVAGSDDDATPDETPNHRQNGVSNGGDPEKKN